ncbi:MAG TPA: CTQ-dependent lysine 6-oxidase LodA [Chthoniobacterales bacterium]|nr:CTQ-dependent lysine 6-oxidase LodA [Chthoniobacterales bacterium]
MRFQIHPSVGVARVGNSPEEFYLAPETTGGLPLECKPDGTPILSKGKATPTAKFKDDEGRVRRQAARFRVFVFDESDPNDTGREVVLGKDVKTLEWTVHVANKKAAWYAFSELEGDLMLGKNNSYAKMKVPFRNESVPPTDARKRRQLIIDPGPRTLSGPGGRAEFSKATIPSSYRFGSFPPVAEQGFQIETLGEMLTDSAGQLCVLGGFGHAGGNEAITSFAGADSWHDDISDGPVTCKVTPLKGDSVSLEAWVLVGSPKFAPELVNIVTLDDLAFDIAVRYQQLDPQMFDKKRWPKSGWNPDYVASYERDIEPIIKRPAGYQWVANVPSMTVFSAPPFDPKDNSAALRSARKTYFSYFRNPGSSEIAGDGAENELVGPAKVPLMPLNSGSNSVSDALIDKFLTLTVTQYFLLGQWADGKFKTGAFDHLGLHPLDRGSLGNCVGSPMCPGIEVTWSTRNPAIYSEALRIAHRAADYAKIGLTPSRDECEGGGCEPGDLTKRMAIPWQADFAQCTVQFINFTDPKVNKQNDIPKPPTYYGYWWPPQSPMVVLSGIADAGQQADMGVPSGMQVSYPRGINNFAEMILGWSYLGFIHNRNTAPERVDYPYFEEVERNNEKFIATSVAVGAVDNFINNTDSTFMPMWFLKSDALPTAASRAKAIAKSGRPAALAKTLAAEGQPLAKPIRAFGVGRMHRSIRDEG